MITIKIKRKDQTYIYGIDDTDHMYKILKCKINTPPNFNAIIRSDVKNLGSLKMVVAAALNSKLPDIPIMTNRWTKVNIYISYKYKNNEPVPVVRFINMPQELQVRDLSYDRTKTQYTIHDNITFPLTAKYMTSDMKKVIDIIENSIGQIEISKLESMEINVKCSYAYSPLGIDSELLWYKKANSISMSKTELAQFKASLEKFNMLQNR